MERKSGVLMHISSLPGKYSIGSFGKEAREFVDKIYNMGFSYWQVLPLGLTDDFNSPYKSYSAFAGNPYFIDLEILMTEGLLTKEELKKAEQDSPYICEFEKLKKTRIDILKKASKRAKNTKEIENFINNNLKLKEFCIYMALKEANHGLAWYEWENSSYEEETLFLWEFIQYNFFKQWSELKVYANSKGIKIIGDIPIYVSLDSSDVWANKELFLLDENNKPKSVAGVPPDYFTPDGQLWGNPIYDWDKMKKDNFSWWKERFFHSFKMFDGVRIDHFRGIESFWSVPFGAKTAKEGKWEKGPSTDFVNMINKIKGDKLVIAEDLGEITEDVIKLVEKSGFPGMRVFQFGFFGNDDNPHKPHNYQKNIIAYSGTHDNNTLLGYIWELDSVQRKNMFEYCGCFEDDFKKGYDSVIRTLFRSHADILILPIQDILCFGSDTRLNTPGKADGNWQYRVTSEQLASIDSDKFKRLNKLYNRD